MTFGDILLKLADSQDLTSDEATWALTSIISGEIPDSQIAAFLFGMRAKGERVHELTAFVNVMRKASVSVDVDITGAVDVCGTGGDHSGSFNISTTVSFVVAGAGVPVVKHGNRSISSLSGSADVLEALGAVAMLEKEKAEQVYRDTGITFLFAPLYHPAMKHVGPVRRSLGMRTFFNILGPLLNPAGVKRQIIGAYSRETASTMAQILAQLDTEAAATVYSHDGLDELSITASAEVHEVRGRLLTSPYHLDATEFGFIRASTDDLKGGDAVENARILRSILTGHGTQAQKDVILLNAGKAIELSGLAGDLKEGIRLAEDSLHSGSAKGKLEAFIEASR